MSERQRRWGFLGAAVVVLAAAVLPGTLFGGGGGEAAQGPDRTSEQRIGAKPRPTVQAAGETRPRSRSLPAAKVEVRRRAEDLLDAYMHYETGDHGPETTKAIEQLTSERLAAVLLRSQPGKARDRAGVLASIESIEPTGDDEFEVFARVRYGDRLSPVSMTFELHSGRWLAASLG